MTDRTAPSVSPSHSAGEVQAEEKSTIKWLVDLPEDLLMSVLQHLTSHALGAFVSTCWQAHALASSRARTEQLKHLYQLMFSVELTSAIGSSHSYCSNAIANVTDLVVNVRLLPGGLSSVDGPLSEYIRANRQLRRLHVHDSRAGYCPGYLDRVAKAAASHTLITDVIIPGHLVSSTSCAALRRALAADSCALSWLDIAASDPTANLWQRYQSYFERHSMRAEERGEQ